ncbi:hypothetical protein GUJ93_ZPchr0012g21428 [Zizania palustris]|uniref:HMA domain-containing protein n=1 Tax=Zizania palustris TaxID=103762 RepID=A0A8J5WLB5_ZIZPA|nr:hypothetical protein GUJ93_ZPchr0012g21428 [Zizania palustris]
MFRRCCCKSMDAVPNATKNKNKSSASGAGAGDGGDGRGGGDGGGGAGGLTGSRRKFQQSQYWVILHVENLEGCHELIRTLAMEFPGVELVTVDVPNNQVTVTGPMATDPDSLAANLQIRANQVVSVVNAPFRKITRSL